VLIISPVVTHPQNNGCFERVFQIAEAVRELGAEAIHFCHVKIHALPQPIGEDAMKAYWGENLTVFDTAWHPAENALGLSWRTSRVFKFFGLMQKVGISSTLVERLAFLHSADMWFPPGLGKWLKTFSESWKPDVVIVEYALLSKAFDYVSGNPRRIIDTHDVFTNRNQRLRKQGIGGDWISFTARQEKKLLQRADTVIAIQKHEADFFQSVVGAEKVALVDVLSKSNRIRSCGQAAAVLGFLGSQNIVNRSSLNWFLQEVWPQVFKQQPGARLRVGGRICEGAPEVPGVEYMDEVNDRDAFYEGCRCMINPCLGGTGLKIKSVESLVYGRPLVSTSHGAAGLENGRNGGLFITDDAGEFGKDCLRMLEKPDDAERAGILAWDFIERRRAQSLLAFSDALGNPMPI
jgi:glycosyltransferase involved in cell wall biosynthesis